MTSAPAERYARWSNARLLWSFVRPYRGRLLLSLLLGLGVTAASLATPMVTKWVLDSIEAPASIVGPVIVLLALLVVSAGLGVVQWVLLGALAENVVLDARRSLVSRFFRSVLGDLHTRPKGELVTRVTSDTVLLREAASSSLVNLVNGTVSLVGTIVLMAVLDVPLLISTLLAIVLVGVLAASLMPRIARAQREAQESVGQLGGLLEGGVGAMRTVKSSGAEEREISRIMDHADDSARHSIRAVRTEAIAWSVAGSGMQLSVIAILALGAWRVSTGGLEVSTMIAFLLYAFGVVEPITELTEDLTRMQAGVAAAERLRQAEEIRTEDVTAGAPVPPGVDGEQLITFNDVSFTYPGAAKPALRGLTVSIPRRGHIAIVGPSGAGKTTVMSLLLRFVSPDHGTITMNGAPYESLAIGSVRQRIAYVEQEAPLLPGTVRDNVAYRHQGLTDDEIWAALTAVHLDETVRRLPAGLDEPVTGTSLSGGQRQRIALARVIVTPPDLLLLDEATAQLDGLTEAAVHEVISRIAQQGTVVTIAHRLSTVTDADTILLLDAGTLRAAGTHTDLLAHDDLYRKLTTTLKITTPTKPEPARQR
ncbi:ABC transporter ATP-binding protein/permease [Streptomyces sp. NBC_00243]|uniref:ABC transporter ATP-binding protein n=1 Tax=Streptomyces sp. NBC_00243 TaxID=2975688 RepID=UPI002DDAB6AE|nr:ABC transporter ATP-binding protein [Streptomyces sp. NBC_00243]WRZ21864.1 ABC transporter ATP-binding protein/permease [Streptomyces sp. NBC_00243]